MLYSRDVIEEVRTGNNIVDVVSGYVQLKQRGSSYVGLCPFHNEKSPSFTVSPDKQIYYCFGCNATGNVITFVMQKENYDFVSALKFLADRIHYALPEHESAEYKRTAAQKAVLVEIHKKAARFFYEALKTEESAAAYLDKRNVSPNVRIKFGIGYSDKKWDSLYKYLQSQDFSKKDILLSGLVNEKNGRITDKFYDRLMFPIMDAKGDVIGFGGRILGDGVPKYMNSPDTMIFDKSRNLYSINNARLSRAREFILVEGYMDVISLYQYGFANAVASLGTAVNAEHGRMIKRYADTAVLLLDSDAAGVAATLRAIPLLLQSGLKVKVMQVINAKDPDEFLKSFGAEAFTKLLSSAKNHIDFQIDLTKQKFDISTPEGKIGFAKESAKILGTINDQITREAYAREISRVTGVSSGAVENEIAKSSENPGGIQMIRSDYNDMVRSKRDSGAAEAKKTLAFLAANDHRAREKIRENLTLSDFGDDVYSAVFEIIYDTPDSRTVEPAQIIGCFETVEEQRTVAGIFNKTDRALSDIIKSNDIPKIEKTLTDSLRTVKSHIVAEKMRTITDINELKQLVDVKRNIERLNITISDG